MPGNSLFSSNHQRNVSRSHTLFFTRENSKYDLWHFSSTAGFSPLLLCACLYKNTRALLLLVFCYSYATWHVLVTHLTTYTQHEKREAKEKWQDRRILQNRTYDCNDAWNKNSPFYAWLIADLVEPCSWSPSMGTTSRRLGPYDSICAQSLSKCSALSGW